MLEIEKLGLVEMDSQEVQEVDGGFWGVVWRGVSIVGAYVLAEYDDLKAGWNAGYNNKPYKYEK